MAAITLCAASEPDRRSEWIRAASFGHQLQVQCQKGGSTFDYATNGLEVITLFAWHCFGFYLFCFELKLYFWWCGLAVV